MALGRRVLVERVLPGLEFWSADALGALAEFMFSLLDKKLLGVKSGVLF